MKKFQALYVKMHGLSPWVEQNYFIFHFLARESKNFIPFYFLDQKKTDEHWIILFQSSDTKIEETFSAHSVSANYRLAIYNSHHRKATKKR